MWTGIRIVRSACACHPSTWEVEAGGSQVLGQPELNSKDLSQNNNKKKSRINICLIEEHISFLYSSKDNCEYNQLNTNYRTKNNKSQQLLSLTECMPYAKLLLFFLKETPQTYVSMYL
jgi:hypothetical protein